MTCFNPVRGYRGRIRTAAGKVPIVFNAHEGHKEFPVDLPCGKCIGCKLEYSRQWAVRCMHEASLYERNCFITLTFDDKHLPVDMSLDPRLFVKFMKRLRKRFGTGVRYFMCGEYGELLGRPHFHACFFNFDFDDKVEYRQAEGKHKLYKSQVLRELWPYGENWIGNVTFESAAYVARYVVKKVTGDLANGISSDGCPGHYTYLDEQSGEFYSRLPEYATMSRNPGIGARWFEKYCSDVYPDNFVVVRGMKCKLPKFYRSKFELLHPDYISDLGFNRKADVVERIVARTRRQAFYNRSDSTRERLKVREEVVRAKVNLSKKKVD